MTRDLWYNMEGEPIDLKEYCRLMEDGNRVAFYEGERYDISTVWLGLNHDHFRTGKPLIFETMVFPKDDMLELEMMRYSTLEEALQGHNAMVAKWLERDKGEPEQDWYFTFGCGHVPYNGKYVKIRGTFNGAREKMISHFGRRWCMQYGSLEDFHAEKWGNTELVIEEGVQYVTDKD